MRKFELICALGVAAFWVFVVACRAQDFGLPAQEPEKKAVKKEKKEKKDGPNLEDSVWRAVGKARHIQGLKFVRVTVVPTDALDDPSLVIIVEFEKGEVGLFQGDDDPEHDQFVVIGKERLDSIQESFKRAEKR